MRFDELHLKAVGHFTNKKLVFDPSKNFHLLYGSNEAGKSTTLRSIYYLLYGFPSRTNDAFLHKNSKLRVEGSLRNNKGEKLTFARRKGNKDTVLNMDGRPMDERMVDQFLHNVPESQFLNMFALNHERLREGGLGLLQSGGNVGESVFSAASGINVVRKIIDRLDKEIRELYLKKGSNPELNQRLKEEKDLKKQLQEILLHANTWKDLEENYRQSKEEIEELNEKIKQLRQLQSKLERMKQILPKVSRRKELLQKLQELKDIPNLPHNIAEIRNSAQSERAAAANELKGLEQEIANLEQQLKEIKIPAEILEQASLIERLNREVNAYVQNKKNLPLLTSEIEYRKKEILSKMEEINPSEAALEKINHFRIPAEKKLTLQELIQEKPALDQQLKQLENQIKKQEKERNEKAEELNNFPEQLSIHELAETIDKAKREGNIEENINKLENACKDAEHSVKDLVKQLPLWDGTYQELVALSIPVLKETIHAFDNERNRLLQQMEELRLQIRQQEKMIQAAEESIRELESNAEIPSEEKLADARKMRDKGWKIIRHKLQYETWPEDLAEYTKGMAIEKIYEDKVGEADKIADTMRALAEKVGEKNKLLSDIAEGKKKIAEFEKEQKELERQFQAWEENWNKLWEPAGIIPLSPAEMKEWLTKYEAIKEKVNQYEKQVREWKDLKAKRTELIEELHFALRKYGHETNENSLQRLLNTADQILENIRDTMTNRKNLQLRIREIEEEIQENENEKEKLLNKMEQWKKRWNEAIEGTSITANTSTKVAQQILEKYDDCIRSFLEYEKQVRRQQDIKEQISQFESNAEQLMAAIGETNSGEAYDLFVHHLYETCQKAKNDQVAYNERKEQLEKQVKKRNKVKFRLEEANAQLEQLLQLASCRTLEELIEVEEKFLQKKNAEQELKKVEEDILSLGSGESLEQLVEESKAYHVDRIDGELQEIMHKLEQLDLERSEKEQFYGAMKKEREEKIQGNNTKAVEMEQKRNSLFSEIAGLTEKYVQLKLASVLLRKGIEEYRSRNQNPIIQRAGELFSRLTLQSFTDLTVDYNEKDEPVLIGVRENGEQVTVEGMSDGTTDQLYLALRIASIEKYISESEPLPFIVDDILVHFDDARSRETLKVLLELADQTQVIFFTHHARLTEIMEEIADESQYQLMEINQREEVSLAT